MSAPAGTTTGPATGDGAGTPAGDGGQRALPVATGRRSAAVLARTATAHPGELAAALVTTALASAGTVALPLLLGRAVDVVRAGTSLTPVLVLLALAAVATAVASALARRDAERLGASIAADLRERVVERSLRMSPRVLERAGSGDVASRVTEDVELFTSSVQLGATVLTSALTVVLSAAGFVSLDWRLALAFCTVFPVYALSLRGYLPRSGPLYAAERAVAARRSQVVLQSFHGASTVHAYGMAALQGRRVEVASERTIGASLAALRTFARLAVSMNGAEAVGLSSLLLTGFLLVRGGDVSVGDVTAAALLFHRLFGPLGALLLSFDEVQRAAAALGRLVGVVDLPDAPDADPGVLERAPRRAVALRVRGVSHAYADPSPGEDPDLVLRAVDLDVPAGTSLAVVGGSGAGKTTLAAIVGGVFPPTAGRVELVGAQGAVDLADLDAAAVRERIGVIAQESHVFTGTLREDLTLARPDATDEDLHRALVVIGADDWVSALPEGLGTRVGPGELPLSPARRQQLALARVVLRDPPVVVLDEATAEAGSAGARDLEQAALAVVAGRTALVVAHRLSQAAVCDAIAVVEAGEVVELGSHADLLARGGRYARLWSTWSHPGRPGGTVPGAVAEP
ncbi:ATP-binding cassette subfamily C protein [Kineococcus radiotolerans]|uniref:ATP-binding cassette subfamily C protein n=1 Tax=Kineococcus radiotolerans TaxID=131568 RepID=A0A7W4TNH6_KINRA|nr:ABC transporter ATP-binding protein [Kineococcus radiotolerans]MBB2902165.1 ATP-binding cassette subfamily C protein [Kineococcus radiotolerans]